MTMSEAVEAVGKMIAAYPQHGPPDQKGYIGAVAAVLADYPRMVAAQCANPTKGVARECKFLPTVADIVAWCDREVQWMKNTVCRQDDDEAYRRRIAEERAKEDKPRYRETYDQLKARFGPNWGLKTVEDVDARARNLGAIARANEKLLAIDNPSNQTIPVSASLRRLVVEQNNARAEWPPAETEH